MIYLLFISPFIITWTLSLHYARKTWKCYEIDHNDIYQKLSVIDTRPKTKMQWLSAQWVRVPTSTYIDPSSQEGLNIFELSKDIGLAKSTQDQHLIKLVTLRIRLWQASIAFLGVFPLLTVTYWAIILL